MTRKEILSNATKVVTGEREEQYGTPEDNFAAIGALWEAYLRARCLSGKDADIYIGPEEVAMMMCLFKIGRQSTSLEAKADTYVDLAGYAACGGELATEPWKKQERV